MRGMYHEVRLVKVALPVLSDLLGPIRSGDVLLVEMEGEITTGVLLQMVEKSRGKVPMVVVVPKGTPEVKSCIKKLDDVQLLVLGRDIDTDRLYELLRVIRRLQEGAVIAAIRLDSLFLKRDEKSVYLFLEDLAGLVQEKNLILVMTIDKRNVSSRQVAMFENLSTHVVDTMERITDSHVVHLLRVKKSPKGGTGFYTMEVKDGRITLQKP